MNRLRQGHAILVVLLLCVSLLALAAGIYNWRCVVVPSAQQFAKDQFWLKEAHAYGGVWESQHGEVRNNSDERGAKLVFGRAQWHDYTLSTDLKFDGDYGDMGVVVRVNDEEEGVDAYNGYYIGLRTTDGTLIIGRSDHGWMEARPVPMPGGVHGGNWYRLSVTAVGCSISAASENLQTRQKAWIAVEENPCPVTGRVGLRSLATGGVWRNLGIRRASQRDSEEMRRNAGTVAQPEFPQREADYNREFHFSPVYVSPHHSASNEVAPQYRMVHTEDLRHVRLAQNEEVALRGVVIKAYPDLYVQDESGGVLVAEVQRPHLNIGDEVEVTGQVEQGLYSSVLRGGKARLLWSGQPEPPIAITALQAASGVYDARYVEVEGLLESADRVNDKLQILHLEQNGQRFAAVVTSSAGDLLATYKNKSRLRVRGVCLVGARVPLQSAPFALLLRSKDDLQLMAAPPWWTPWHIAFLAVVVIALALVVQLIYFQLKEWQRQAVSQERDRIAHDLHDTMAQSFAGVGYQIQGIRSGLKRRENTDVPLAIAQLDLAYQTVRKLHEEASQIIAMLHASNRNVQEHLLDSLMVTTARITCDRVQTESSIEGEPFLLNMHLANTMLQIGKEAITNAVIHGSPTLLRLKLVYRYPLVELSICDNGTGFVYAPAAEGFGIQGMQKRAQSIDAELLIESAPGEGTCVSVAASVRGDKMLRRAWRSICNIVRRMMR